MDAKISGWSVFIISLLVIRSGLFAQDTGSLVLIQDPRIPVLIERHIAINQRQPGVMEGYRVQIFFDSGTESKKRALEARAEFLEKFPDVPAYISFQEPFFKVRVGDYRLKVEAEGLKQKILGDYPNAYTVIDRINYPRFDQVTR